MSMNFSEFKKRLGAEPLSRDPKLLAARDSAPEFEAAANDARRLEEKLARAFALPSPDDLLGDILDVSNSPAAAPVRKAWWPMAMAASVLVAVGAAGLVWNSSRGWDSVEDYLVEHYRYDGPQLISKAGQSSPDEVQAVLAEFNVAATPALADIIGVIKYCPTPDGEGVHMVLNTEKGPVTVFYMPETSVQDHELLAFDGNEAILVELKNGSAAIIGAGSQGIQDLYAIVHDSIVPLPGSS